MGKTGPENQSHDLETAMKQAIIDSGMTHYAIGKASSVAPDMIGRFMRGDRGINLATASKLATTLGYVLVDSKLLPKNLK